MIRGTWKFALFALANIATAGSAFAGLLPLSAVATADGPNNFRYTYGIVLTTDSKLQKGDYFTVFDFPNPIPNTAVTPAGWTLNLSPLGGNPHGTVPGDDSKIPNLTWTYNGPTLVGQKMLGSFSIDTTVSTSALQQFSFTSLTQRVSDNANDSNITATTVPVGNGHTTGGGGGTPPGVPEPSSIMLIGIGLPLIGLLRYLRRQPIAAF